MNKNLRKDNVEGRLRIYKAKSEWHCHPNNEKKQNKTTTTKKTRISVFIKLLDLIKCTKFQRVAGNSKEKH